MSIINTRPRSRSPASLCLLLGRASIRLDYHACMLVITIHYITQTLRLIFCENMRYRFHSSTHLRASFASLGQISLLPLGESFVMLAFSNTFHEVRHVSRRIDGEL